MIPLRAPNQGRVYFLAFFRYNRNMTKFGWTMLTLIFIIVVAVVLFVWTGISEHVPVSTQVSEDVSNVSETQITSGDNPAPGSVVHDLPVPPAVDAARNALAARLNVSNSKSIIILTAFEKEWPDSCLGLSKEGELCAQAITSGYEVTMQKDGVEYVYRTNTDGTIVRSEEKQ